MTPLWQPWLLIALMLACHASGQITVSSTSTNNTGPLSSYKSRPDIQAPFLSIDLFHESYVEPGYIFLAPYQTNQPSVYMYDNRGNLVWTGFGPTGGGIYHNFHVCSIEDVDHLCFYNGNQYLGYGRGHGMILDNTLSSFSSVQCQGGLGSNDEHEFNIVDGGKAALITSYVPSLQDLSAYNITGGQGWIIDNYFQKVNIATNELIFEWRALDYVSISDTYVKPGSTDVSGTGLMPFSPFDWFHINSVDQNADGDYLVSARHTSTVYKVSGQTGSIIWRLGGVSSDFSFAPGLNFSFQHDARFRYENASTTIISIFDNASNGYNQSSRYSSGMVIKIDHEANHASLLRQYIAPTHFVSNSQGNIQVLGKNSEWKSANIFAGWGSQAVVSEYTNDGTMVLNAHFATEGSMNYRAYKYNFTTNPTDAPASYVYAHNTSAPTVFYMSWNGATQAAQWRVYVSQSKNGIFEPIAKVPKNGFETIYKATKFHAWSMVESLDAYGKSLRNTTRKTSTFVPSRILAPSCNEYECAVATAYGSNSARTASSSASSSAASTSISKDPAKRKVSVGATWVCLGIALLALGMMWQ